MFSHYFYSNSREFRAFTHAQCSGAIWWYKVLVIKYPSRQFSIFQCEIELRVDYHGISLQPPSFPAAWCKHMRSFQCSC